MSSFIDKLKIGEFLEIMGPIGNVKFTPRTYNSIGMIAGGTGITPIYQIIQHVLNNPQDTTKLTLLYANNQERDILLKSELENLHEKFPTKFVVHHVLVEATSSTFEKGFITKELIKKYLNLESLIMVCGPPKMEEVIIGYLDEIGKNKINKIAFTHAATHVEHGVSSRRIDTEYSFTEISRHNKEGDCWLVIEDKVYDATSFVDEHPGGYIILDGAGKDATGLFNSDFPHSPEAREELAKLQIGVVKK